MSKTVLIEFSPYHPPKEFSVGSFVSIGYPHRTGVGFSPMGRPTFSKFLDWINDLAPKGLIYTGEFDGEFIFRVDGAVIEQLKELLTLSYESVSVYAGESEDRSLYKEQVTLYLKLDEERIGSEVCIP